MSFEPFIEGEENVVIQPVSGGINLSTIAHVLQGIDQRNKYRFKGTLPILGTGEEDNIIRDINIGQEKDFDDSTPFVDKFEPTSLEYKNSPETFYDFSFMEGFSESGVIEPFTIRGIASFSSIELPFVAKSIKGEFEGINLDVFGGSNQIKQSRNIVNPVIVEPYEDSADYFGSLLTGSVKLPGYYSDIRKKIIPFNESLISRRFVTNNSSINNSLNDMTSSYDDELVPYRNISCCAGYTYFSSSSGTDSIAFGNMMRM